MRGHRWKALAGLAVTVALLWWALHDVSAAEVWRHVSEADRLWLAAMVATATFIFLPRAWRWDVLLGPVAADTRFSSRFGAVCIGFMANNLLPARLGEFARAFSLSRVEPVGMSAAFGSLVVERIFDGLVLATFLGTALVVPGSPLAGEGNEALRRIALGATGIFVLGGGSLWVMARYPRKVLRIFEHTLGRLLTPDLTDRGVEILAAFLDGLGALHRVPVFLRTLAWSLVVWLVGAVSIWCGFRAFGIVGPGLGGAAFLQAVIGFAVAIPSSPGFFGPFEAAARFGLEFYGVGASRIVSFAVGYHILTFIPVTLLGLWYARRLGIRWSEIEHSEEIVGAAVDAEEEPEEMSRGTRVLEDEEADGDTRSDD